MFSRKIIISECVPFRKTMHSQTLDTHARLGWKEETRSLNPATRVLPATMPLEREMGDEASATLWVQQDLVDDARWVVCAPQDENNLLLPGNSGSLRLPETRHWRCGLVAAIGSKTHEAGMRLRYEKPSREM